MTYDLPNVQLDNGHGIHWPTRSKFTFPRGRKYLPLTEESLIPINFCVTYLEGTTRHLTQITLPTTFLFFKNAALAVYNQEHRNDGRASFYPLPAILLFQVGSTHLLLLLKSQSMFATRGQTNLHF